MNEDLANGKKSIFRDLTARIGSRKDEFERIKGFHVGNIKSEKPVLIRPQAIVVGDVYAPQIEVSGFIFGYLVAGEVIVAPGGQVWGDICTPQMMMGSGAIVHGWISAIDKETTDLLRAGELSIPELPRTGDYYIPEEQKEILEKLYPDYEEDHKEQLARSEIWQRLANEVATALAARYEIERSDFHFNFDESDEKMDPVESPESLNSNETADQVSIEQLQATLENYQSELSKSKALIAYREKQLEKMKFLAIKRIQMLENELKRQNAIDKR